MVIKNFVYFNVEEYTTLSTLILTTIGYMNLVRLCYPFNKLRLSCLGISLVLMLMASALIPSLFGFYQFSLNVFLVYLVLVVFSALILIFVPMIKARIVERNAMHIKKNNEAK